MVNRYPKAHSTEEIMGPALPFSYTARSLAVAHGLHADIPNPDVKHDRPVRRTRRWKRHV